MVMIYPHTIRYGQSNQPGEYDVAHDPTYIYIPEGSKDYKNNGRLWKDYFPLERNSLLVSLVNMVDFRYPAANMECTETSSFSQSVELISALQPLHPSSLVLQAKLNS